MNFEQNKFGHPFNPGNSYFNDLSGRIQQRIGIEVIKVQENVEPKIEFTKKQRQAPVQLTVEFGFPLTAEKNEIESKDSVKDISAVLEVNTPHKSDEDQTNSKNTITDIGEIHIEPINLKPNATPYWHQFNDDDELEGLVLDSEGQEMSDITITGDLAFDLDQQIFHETTSVSAAEMPIEALESPIINETIVDFNPLPIVDEVFEQIEIQEFASQVIDEINTEVSSFDNGVETLAVENNIDIHESNEQTSLVTDVQNVYLVSEENTNEVSNVIENENREFAIADEMNSKMTSLSHDVEVEPLEDEFVPSFAFSFVPEMEIELPTQTELLQEEIQIESIAEDVLVKSEVIAETINSIEIVEQVENSIVPQEILNEVIVSDNQERDERQVVTELTFSDADLDSLHEQLSSQLEPTKLVAEVIAPVEDVKQIIGDVELEFSDADLDALHESMSKELPVADKVAAKKADKKVETQEKVYAQSYATTEVETETYKPTIFDMIPWSSVFGVVASLMAIASAWFIWNSIQKPIAIDEFIDKTIAPTVQVAVPTSSQNIAVESNLSPSDYIATSIIEDANSADESVPVFQFSELSERSKVSAVELERLGLTTLSLEDGFFEEPIF